MIEIKRSRTYSQGGQDGIIKSIFDWIGTVNKECVEFGFNSTELTGGTGSNTARLILEGWTGQLFDCDNENPEIHLNKERLTSQNIGEIFSKYGVHHRPDYVSIDVDGDDLWLFKGMLEAGYKPRVISVEYNARFPITESITMREGCGKWEEDAAYGASMLALNTVASEYYYNLVAVESGLDLFFVRDDCGLKGMPLSELEPYTDICVHPIPSPERQKLFVRYPSLEPVLEHPWFNSGRQPIEPSDLPLMP